MDDQLVAAMAMARTVKRARGALVEAVRRALHGAEGSVPRAAHTQVFESLDPDGTRLTVLAERAQMSHQAMGEMVEELVRHGYLERVPDPVDRRARLIRATALGRTQLVRAAAEVRLLYQGWQRELNGLTVDQVVGALDILIRICGESDTAQETQRVPGTPRQR
jgi:DNA-binding MarR family transcriptional regulator